MNVQLSTSYGVPSLNCNLTAAYFFFLRSSILLYKPSRSISKHLYFLLTWMPWVTRSHFIKASQKDNIKRCSFKLKSNTCLKKELQCMLFWPERCVYLTKQNSFYHPKFHFRIFCVETCHVLPGYQIDHRHLYFGNNELRTLHLDPRHLIDIMFTSYDRKNGNPNLLEMIL